MKMEKYDITKPIKIPVGMHKLNNDASISFQLNRLVNMDGCDLAVAKEIGNTIKSAADFYTVLKKHGGFDSSYEEFFAECEYLREQGYNVYLFEGPGQGECIRLHGVPLIIEWEKPVMAVTKYFDLHNVILIGQSLGGFYAPRASAFDDRVTKCVSIAQFGALKMNFHNNAFVNGLVWGLLNVILFLFGWFINIIYAAQKGKGMAFFRTYFHRFVTTNVYKLIKYLHAIDLRPVADKLTKDYLIIGGSKDTMACRAGIGRQMLILKNARSVTAREITEREFGADHCCCGNQLAAMDAVLLWAELMERRDKSLDEKNN